MVAAVTNHDWEFIEWQMPVAKGLQAQALWHDLEASRHGQPGRLTRPLTPAGGRSLSSLAG